MPDPDQEDYFDPEPWDDDLIGPERTEPDFESEALEEYWQHRDEAHGGAACDCPALHPADWPAPDPDHPSFAEEAPF
jgi:hypothetical protein